MIRQISGKCKNFEKTKLDLRTWWWSPMARSWQQVSEELLKVMPAVSLEKSSQKITLLEFLSKLWKFLWSLSVSFDGLSSFNSNTKFSSFSQSQAKHFLKIPDKKTALEFPLAKDEFWLVDFFIRIVQSGAATPTHSNRSKWTNLKAVEIIPS